MTAEDHAYLGLQMDDHLDRSPIQHKSLIFAIRNGSSVSGPNFCYSETSLEIQSMVSEAYLPVSDQVAFQSTRSLRGAYALKAEIMQQRPRSTLSIKSTLLTKENPVDGLVQALEHAE
jgi:hypothetical protein